MFTGHIRELGLVDSFDGERIQVRVPESAPAISAGSSVCVSGVRLTVRDVGGEVFGATVAAETRRRSTFDSLGAGELNDELEQPALARMLLPVRGASVVELGCGDGALARRLAGAGARDVLAVDSARRMLALAARQPHPRVRYLRHDIETLNLPAGSADRVVSSLAVHYVRDYQGLIGRVARWLRPGGQFVFSMEHPICTAMSPMTGWLTAGDATVWPVDHYAEETARAQEWLGGTVLKYHRRLATVISAILTAGLTLTGLDEPCPDDDALTRQPDLAQHRRRPPLLLAAAAKPEPGEQDLDPPQGHRLIGRSAFP